MNWQADKRWSDRFICEIQGILGRAFIREAEYIADATEATDLMVFNVKPIRVACRVRKLVYFERYGAQFTIRASRPSGNRTELEKISEGWADWMLYGHANKDETALAYWWLLDLSVFRREVFKTPKRYRNRKWVRDNGDGVAFYAWPLEVFPSELVHPDSVIYPPPPKRWTQSDLPLARTHHAIECRENARLESAPIPRQNTEEAKPS